MFEKENDEITTVSKLESSINDLLLTCQQLTDENRALKKKQAEWPVERSCLLEKNERVRARLELMISRLKMMEVEL
ncbi:MAG: TIGR02449 family protein [Gammaproteobacteria bacterium]|nr:TIGR02449 family protein [Gammaproteobacteria bacterium]